MHQPCVGQAPLPSADRAWITSQLRDTALLPSDLEELGAYERGEVPWYLPGPHITLSHTVHTLH